MKGDGGHYFYPAANPKTIKEAPRVHKNDIVQTDLNPGDEVACDAGHGRTMFGVVNRIGRTMVHVKMRSGEILAFLPKHVELMTQTYWQDKAEANKPKWMKKQNVFRDQPSQENTVPGHSAGFKPGAGPGIQNNKPMEAVLPPIKAKTPKIIKPKAKTSSCRAGQVQTGMQTKDGKLVPKCSVR
jgi:hypothetical protein